MSLFVSRLVQPVPETLRTPTSPTDFAGELMELLPGPEQPLGRADTVSRYLWEQLPELLGEVSVEQALWLSGDNRTLKNPDDYSFQPITAKPFTLLRPPGWDCAVPDGTRVAYEYRGKVRTTPFLDKVGGVALTFKNIAGAVASGEGVVYDTPLVRVGQVQGLLKEHQTINNPELALAYQKVLHGGFRWDRVLVSCWALICKRLGVDLSLQGYIPGVNNMGYDELANQMHFKKDHIGHWNWPLFGRETTPTVEP